MVMREGWGRKPPAFGRSGAPGPGRPESGNKPSLTHARSW